MLARRADSLLSLMGETEKVIQQPNQPPTVRLLGEFVGNQAVAAIPKIRKTISGSMVNARRIEVRELGLGPQGIKRFAGDLSVQADCGVGIAEGLDCDGSGGEGLRLSNRSVQSGSGTSLLGQPVAARLLYRDPCAPRRRQGPSTWRRVNSILRTRGRWRGRHAVASQLAMLLLHNICKNDPLFN